MIRYALRCSRDHAFESWFRSAEEFDGLVASGLVECPACGARDVTKALMAPRVAASDRKAAPPPAAAGAAPAADGPAPMASAAEMPAKMRRAIEKLRAEVEANSDYVGRSFASEARAIHEGDSPRRAIHGEANAEEARALLSDGIPVLPLPFRDRRGQN
ncbi:DUF1178 family protein [Mangrovicoccus algicola]|uniref:DUF1178 family protein n=1 Tax=Mangrovicoccus algicola TaxID=2771008 RepID=A0A8J6Z8J0_9RHOB|nr:DUF1178 family protein [Mangrovicoccus algicola]MBE3637811.1 DUF1178 family protein [Mangrovicoccus algicola]